MAFACLKASPKARCHRRNHSAIQNRRFCNSVSGVESSVSRRQRQFMKPDFGPLIGGPDTGRQKKVVPAAPRLIIMA